jgi:hypothetical protein
LARLEVVCEYQGVRLACAAGYCGALFAHATPYHMRYMLR